jgi:hypothetical protein
MSDAGDLPSLAVASRLTALVAAAAEDADRDPYAELLGVVLEMVPGARWASLTRRSVRGVCSTMAASDEVARDADQVQIEANAGPAIEAMRTGQPVVAFDLVTDLRWPRSTALLRSRTPVVAVASIPMGPPGAAASSLNLYSSAPGAFTAASTLDEIQLLLVEVALAGLQQGRRAHNLHRALVSNRRIGMAVGVLMTHRRLTEEQAFAVLTTASQALNRKTADLADEVCLTGTLPDHPTTGGEHPPRPR